MFRNRKYHFDIREHTRKLKRYFEGNINYRKLLIVLFIIAIIILYIGPYIFSWIFTRIVDDGVGDLPRCLDDRLTPFFSKVSEMNAHIIHYTKSSDDALVPTSSQKHIPYVGNGYVGFEIGEKSNLHLKIGRHLSHPIEYYPVVSSIYQARETRSDERQAVVVDYLNGIVQKFQCFGNDFSISHDFYAHRTVPQLFVQEIKMTNHLNSAVNIILYSKVGSAWPGAKTRDVNLRNPETNELIEFVIVSGTIDIPKSNNRLTIAIMAQKLPTHVTIKKRGTTKLDIPQAISYSLISAKREKQTTKLESDVNEIMMNVLRSNHYRLSLDSLQITAGSATSPKQQHINVWNDLWQSGFHISQSMADKAINGDQINATIYFVLSHARSFEQENKISDSFRAEIQRSLSYAEGCFDSYPTLQADSLWKQMNTIESANQVVMSWLLTLEKQGCHNLLRAGASGILQAMILSFGGFSFSNQHLELNIHPKHLHRDHFFRRINYGNMTHLNISIEVADDNRAELYVALDRSDGKYYACDGGCLDEPIALSRERIKFPVKLTEPVTAILYIASDREHIEELRHAIHVKEVNEAPAHEHHVIALHKHGNQLGSLPTFFWISIVAIIIVFHIFLCKLIVKEYFEPSEKLRYRYDKP